jgi:hypothetical protein
MQTRLRKESSLNSSPAPIFDAQQRAHSYWFADGLPSLVAGVYCLAFAFCFLHLEVETPLYNVLRFASGGLLLTLILCRQSILEWLKRG